MIRKFFDMLHTVWLYLNELKCHKEVTWFGCVWIYDLVSDHKKNISSRFYNTVDFNFSPLRIFQFQPTFWVFIEFLDHSKFKNFIKFHQIFIYVKSYLTKMDISERISIQSAKYLCHGKSISCRRKIMSRTTCAYPFWIISRVVHGPNDLLTSKLEFEKIEFHVFFRLFGLIRLGLVSIMKNKKMIFEDFWEG